MPIQIGARRDQSFNEPLERLRASHRRIEKFLDQLLSVAGQAGGGPLTTSQSEALSASLRYLRKAAPLQTADEELSLFPRMRASGDRLASGVLALLESLESEHQAAGADYREVDALCQEWLSTGRLAPEQTVRLEQGLQRLQALYARHNAVEDLEVFPVAASLLSPSDICALGDEMSDRRRASWKHIPFTDSLSAHKRGE